MTTPAEQDLPLIISVDDHILEPRELWQEELPANLRERGPKVSREKVSLHFEGGHYGFTRDADDGQWCDVWLFDDLVVPTGFLHAPAGVPRDQAYVTNAVKHFEHEPRGKRRLHKTPNTGEVTACRWWLDAERRLVRPRAIVAMGGTAVLSVFGKPLPIAAQRQKAHQLEDQAQGVVTYHPSYLLRVPDAAAKAEAYRKFVEDLAFAWKLVA